MTLKWLIGSQSACVVLENLVLKDCTIFKSVRPQIWKGGNELVQPSTMYEFRSGTFVLSHVQHVEKTKGNLTQHIRALMREFETQAYFINNVAKREKNIPGWLEDACEGGLARNYEKLDVPSERSHRWSHSCGSHAGRFGDCKDRDTDDVKRKCDGSVIGCWFCVKKKRALWI